MVKKKHLAQTSTPAYGAIVSLHEVLNAGARLEAAAYSIAARQARAELAACSFPLLPLLSSKADESALGVSATNGNRFSRIYVNSSFGVPFLSSSDIIGLRPERDRYVSRKHTKDLESFMIEPWDVLISRSGTIGNVSLAPPGWSEFSLSEHAIRLKASDPDMAGYIACFLRSRWGRDQMLGHSYGSVITHIETHHLQRIFAPKLPPILTIEIGRGFVDAAMDRDEANKNLGSAEQELISRLKLPGLSALGLGPTIATVNARDLRGRFEAAYHDPRAQALEKTLGAMSFPVKSIGDPSTGFTVRAVTKFRKRVYVDSGGIPMLSSKQLFQVDPIDVKRLARGAHVDDLPEIELSEGMLCISCSGTIGRVFSVPQYMNGWTANQHALRIAGEDRCNSAYLYAWLASEYGQVLLLRERYGSVIQELDRYQLGRIPVPWLPDADRKRIASYVLAADAKRTSAWIKEQRSLKRLTEILGP
jgi:type I restriction enzyme S subunit